MKQTIGQKGFSAIVAIIILAVIAGLGVGGWYVWDKNKKEGSSNKSDNSSQGKNDKHNDGPEGRSNPLSKTFDCKDAFAVTYPDSLRATVTNAGQCLISNVSVEEMPAVGPLPPEQIGLFFNVQTTEATTGEEFLQTYIARSQEDYALELKSEEQLRLNNNKTAILATIFGGHPVQHNFYFFIYIKDGKAITTSYPTNLNHKEVVLDILKSIK